LDFLLKVKELLSTQKWYWAAIHIDKTGESKVQRYLVWIKRSMCMALCES
jgi:hypothetical protein